MIPTLSSSRSAIWLNWVETARSSSVPVDSASVATRDARSPSASRREASVRRVIGSREAVGEERRHEHGDHERGRRHDQQQPVDRGEGARAAGARVGQADLDAPVAGGVGPAPRRDRRGDRRDRGAVRDPSVPGPAPGRRATGRTSGTSDPSVSNRAGPNSTCTVAWARRSADCLEQAPGHQQVVHRWVERRLAARRPRATTASLPTSCGDEPGEQLRGGAGTRRGGGASSCWRK